MFRFLLYRTDLGNTIIDESNSSFAPLGPNEAELFTDYEIPEIQPLYLYRVTGGTTVIPNIDSNIEAYLDEITPTSPDDEVTLGDLTGVTANTQSQIDFLSAATSANTANKIDKVTTGTTDNLVILRPDGGLNDAGISVSDLQNSLSGVTQGQFNSYTGATETRLQGIESDVDAVSGQTDTNTADIAAISAQTDTNTSNIATVSGQTDTNTSNIASVSGQTDTNTSNIASVSGQTDTNTSNIASVSAQTDTNTSNIATVSGQTDTNTSNIASVSGQTDQNTADILAISGITNSKQDQLTAGEGINVVALGNDIVQVDLSSFTAIGGINISLTGTTNAVIQDLRTITSGLEYAADYSSGFTSRSLVDVEYVQNRVIAAQQGMVFKDPARLATSTGDTDIDLTGGLFGGTIDGTSLLDGDRVLIKNQDSNPEQNGIYDYDLGTNTFTRSLDAITLSAGTFVFVDQGNDNRDRSFVLTTDDPITVGTTPLTWGTFNTLGDISAGTGILISPSGVITFDGAGVAGDSISWDGVQLNIDVSSGNTLFTEFANKLDVSAFNTYTGDTETRLQGIESDIVFISGVTDTKTDNDEFTGFTATTDSRLDAIEGTLSGGSVVTQEQFTGYTATTETRLQGIESDITFISGVTDTKLDTDIFTGFTASTARNDIQLVSTASTSVNVIIPVALTWDDIQEIGSSYSFTAGGTQITINETADYEISYSVNMTHVSGGRKTVGFQIIQNSSTVLAETSASAYVRNADNETNAVLPPTIVSLTAGDTIELVGFRRGSGGNAETTANATLLRISKLV
jgi:hypothetical protein